MNVTKKLMLLILVFMSCGVLLAKAHPFLFMTRADIERAKKTIQVDPNFAKLADDLVDSAKKADINKLPELDFKWHEKQKIDLNLQTYHKPLPWATFAQKCARASVFEPELALKVKEALLHLSHYEFEELAKDSALNHARVAYSALDAYDIIYDTLSDGDRAMIDDYFNRLVATVIKGNDYWVANTPGGVPVNNHICWHNLCIGMYGLFYDKPELVNRSLYGPRGMEFMINFGFRDNGLWGEASLMYHFVALQPILLMAEILENADYPVSLYHPNNDGRDLKQAYDAFFQLVMPNLYFPRVGDTYGRLYKFHAGITYEILYTRFGDPKYAWLINRQDKRDSSALFHGKTTIPQVKDIGMESVLLPEQGYAFLRTNEGSDYWNGKGWTLMANYSDVYVHRHLDKMSIMLFGDGHLWLTDAGQKFIGKGMVWNIVKGLNRQTISHNTVMVDNKTQNDLKRKLDLVEYSSLPAVKRVSIADYSSQLYSGVKQMRTCIATEKYVLDVFQVVSQKRHRFRWISHVSGESEFCSVNDFEDMNLPQGLPWSELKNARRSKRSTTPFREIFASDNKKFAIDIVTDVSKKILKCDYRLDDRETPETEPTIMVEVDGKTAIFVAVYRTENVEQPVAIKITPSVMRNLMCEVKIGKENYLHRLPQLVW